MFAEDVVPGRSLVESCGMDRVGSYNHSVSALGSSTGTLTGISIFEVSVDHELLVSRQSWIVKNRRYIAKSGGLFQASQLFERHKSKPHLCATTPAERSPQLLGTGHLEQPKQ